MEKSRKHYVFKALLMLIYISSNLVSYAQQEIILKGVVNDVVNGVPLEGVTVEAIGFERSTQTDHLGSFTISVSLPVTLVFRSVGYSEREIEVVNTNTIVAQLTPESFDLDEVVVVGYGVQKKTSLTAAVSTLKGETVESLPIANLSNALGGRVSGVVVKQGSGEPGADGSNIYIRGVSTTGNSSPLLVVDGIPRSFQQLNPSDVETFTVLKDAAAVAPYGVAGANGVILVTTKRGATGRPTISYNGYVGFQNPTVFPEYVNGYEYALLKNAAAINNGLPAQYSESEILHFKNGTEPDLYPPNDPFNQIVQKNTIVTNHALDVSGGSEVFKYYVGFGYLHQDGMWPTTFFERYNLTSNIDIQATTSTKISLNLNGRVENANYPAVGTSRVFELLGFGHPSLGPLEFSNGMYGNYVMGAIYDSGYRKHKNNILYTQLSVEQHINAIPGLNLKGTIAYDPSYNFHKNWRTPTRIASIIDRNERPFQFKEDIFEQTQPSLAHNVASSNQLTSQIGLTYSRSFSLHNVSALMLFEAQSNNWQDLGLSRRNFDLYIDEINMGSSNNSDMNTSGSSARARQIGAVYRLSYDYNSKYLLEASGRYDGHYFFAPGKQFGFFPAISGGWRLSEESFIKDNVSWIHNLKIRASYGEVGALAGGPFQYLSSYNVLGGSYKFGDEIASGVRERSEPNLNITWERAKKTDVGVEFSTLKGALSLELDYFYENRSNMLVTPNVITPVEYGIGLSQVNAGVMENRGVDLSFSYNKHINSNWGIFLEGTFTYAKNRMLEIFETSSTYDNLNRRLTGRSLGTQFGYKALGFFQTDDFEDNGDLKPGITEQPWGRVQPGDIRYDDVNNDGFINEDDFVEIGYPANVPLITYGFSPTISFRNISLSMLFQGAAKSHYYYSLHNAWPFYNGMSAFREHFDYWTPESTDARHPRLTTAPTANNTQISSFWIRDVSYLRLKNVVLAYTLPSTISNNLKMERAQVYLSGQNLLTWTDLKNFDPEMNSGGFLGYPQQRVISLGLNVTF